MKPINAIVALIVLVVCLTVITAMPLEHRQETVLKVESPVVLGTGLALLKAYRERLYRKQGFLPHSRDKSTGRSATHLDDLHETLKQKKPLSPPVIKAIKRLRRKETEGKLRPYFPKEYLPKAKAILAAAREHPVFL